MSTLLARRTRENSISAVRAARIHTAFLGHIDREYLIIDIRRNVIVKSANLVNHRPLRSLDAIQLAWALYARDLLEENFTFVSADNNLLKAAADEGFEIDSPLNHVT
jgi:hypothetical protein